jgi:hypothetical protein
MSEEQVFSNQDNTRGFLANIYVNLPDAFAGYTNGQFLGASRDCMTDNAISYWDVHYYHAVLTDGYTLIPELIPSLTFGVEAYGVDARVMLTAYLNRSVFLSPAISFSGWSNMGTHEVTKAWGYYNDDPADPRNINAVYPRPTYGGYNAIDSDRGSGTYQNDIWIRSGDYLALRNVELGYSLPKTLIAKLNLTQCRIYFSGYNLFNWSDLPRGTDPEKPMSYCWWYPKTKSFSFGLNVGF